MATRCFTPVLGKRIRAVSLDACAGLPEEAAEDSMVVTDGFISVSLSSEVEDGAEIITRKASGAICVNEKASDSFKRFTLEMEFCGVDPGLLALVTNAEIYENYEQVAAGIVVPEGSLDKQFSLELWTGLSGSACEPGAEEASGYMLLPFLNAGVLGDISIDGENAVSFSMTGAYTKGGNAWGVGPFNVMADNSDPETPVPAPLPTPLDPLDHLLLVETGIAPPASECGLQPFVSTAA